MVSGCQVGAGWCRVVPGCCRVAVLVDEMLQHVKEVVVRDVMAFELRAAGHAELRIVVALLLTICHHSNASSLPVRGRERDERALGGSHKHA